MAFVLYWIDWAKEISDRMAARLGLPQNNQPSIPEWLVNSVNEIGDQHAEIAWQQALDTAVNDVTNIKDDLESEKG